MTETFRCGDEAGLVAFAYEDGDPAELAAVAAHVATCAECAAILASLADTRHLLASWIPPDARLGFRITDETAAAFDQGPRGVVAAFSGPPPPVQWWRQPLPAWAQAAAAIAIFGIGLWAGGVGRTPGTDGQSLTALRAAVTALEARAGGQAETTAAGTVDVTAALGALSARVAQAEQRAANAEAAIRLVGAAPSAPAASTQAITNRMLRQAIEQSEQRQINIVAQRLEAHRREQVERQDSRDEQIRTSFDERWSNVVRVMASGALR